MDPSLEDEETCKYYGRQALSDYAQAEAAAILGLDYSDLIQSYTINIMRALFFVPREGTA